MWNRAERHRKRWRRRIERAGRGGVEQVTFSAPLDNLFSISCLEAFARSGLRSGTEVVVDGRPVTHADADALRQLLDDNHDNNGGHIEVPSSLKHLLPVPGNRPAPDASDGWTENVVAHNQTAAALVDLLNLDHEAWEAAAVFKTLTRIGLTMPSHASVSAVVEHEGEHILATLSVTGWSFAVTLAPLRYPSRWYGSETQRTSKCSRWLFPARHHQDRMVYWRCSSTG